MSIAAAITILAQNGEGWVQLLVLVAFVVISLIGGLLRRSKEKYEQEQARREAEARRQREQADRARPPQGRPTPPPPPARTPIEEIVHAMRQAAQEQGKPTLSYGPRQAQPVPPPPPPPVPTRDEVSDLRERLRILEQRRARQAPTRPAARAKAPSPSRLGVQPQEQASQPQPQIRLTAAAARQGIILSEILGPPLALRRNPGLWDE